MISCGRLNPALPCLLALSLGGLAFRRRSELALGFSVAGLAATALLAPALARPDGVPSNAGLLARLPPWQAGAGSESGIPELVDVAFQVEPWLLHLRGELRAGRLPFWNPHQFAGAPFWGNGQSAPLFPLHLLFVVLPVDWGLVLLPWLRVVVGGLGAFLLARELGASRSGAALAAVVLPLSGRFASFLLFPMANALCLVPWVFLAVERLARGRRGFLLLSAAGGLQLLGGHPETAAYTALASGLYLAVRGASAPRAAWSRFGLGWATAGALSAVQVLPLAATVLASSRWQDLSPGAPPSATVVLSLLLRFLLPHAFGHAADGTYWGPYAFIPTSVYAGALTLPLAAAGAGGARRDRRLLAWVAVLGVCLAAAYQAPGLREVFALVPVLRRGVHHYLLLGVALALAILAGVGLDRWREGKGRGVVAGAGAVLLALGAAWLAHAGAWRTHGQTRSQVLWTLAVAGAASLLAAALLLPQRARRLLAPALVALAAADLASTHGRAVPSAAADRRFPAAPALAFLRGRPERVAGVDFALRPNAAMVYGLHDVRGDDNLKLGRYEAVYAAHLGRGYPVFFQPLTRWQSPWLDRLGVRWVLAGPDALPLDPAWTAAYRGPDATVFERPGALPLARFEPPAAGGSLEVVRREPGRWEIAWEASGPARLVVAETWDPGWRARLDGRPISIATLDGVLMAVAVGPGSGRLALRYRPQGLAWGAALSLVGLLCLGLGTRFLERTTPA